MRPPTRSFPWFRVEIKSRLRWSWFWRKDHLGLQESLHQVEVPLGRLTILFGPNGAGKTNTSRPGACTDPLARDALRRTKGSSSQDSVRTRPRHAVSLELALDGRGHGRRATPRDVGGAVGRWAGRTSPPPRRDWCLRRNLLVALSWRPLRRGLSFVVGCRAPGRRALLLPTAAEPEVRAIAGQLIDIRRSTNRSSSCRRISPSSPSFDRGYPKRCP